MAFDFHSAIAKAAGSVELQQQLKSLCNQIKFVMTAGLASLTRPRAEEIHAEHLALIAAIAERDGDRAEQLASAHVRAARDRWVTSAATNERRCRLTPPRIIGERKERAVRYLCMAPGRGLR